MINPHLLNPIDFTVGWEQTSYIVSEDIGSFEAFYSVLFPTSKETITNSLFMRVATVVGTAGKIPLCVYSDNYDSHSALIYFILVCNCTMYRRG